jgi:hypothetical protein
METPGLNEFLMGNGDAWFIGFFLYGVTVFGNENRFKI